MISGTEGVSLREEPIPLISHGKMNTIDGLRPGTHNDERDKSKPLPRRSSPRKNRQYQSRRPGCSPGKSRSNQATKESPYKTHNQGAIECGT